MSLLAKIAIPLIAGAIVASASMVGIVYSQTAAPSKNPADTPALTYGDK